MHVLVIDDDKDFSHLLSAHLTRNGHRVTVAGDGIQGQRVARTEHPDVITIDYHMPSANGLVVAERLAGSAQTGNIPMVVLTGSPLEGIEDQLLAVGVHKVLSKLTLTEHDLVEALEEAVEAHTVNEDREHSQLFPGD